MSSCLLICGTIAFDSIMTFPGQFQDHLVTEQLNGLTVSFEADQLRRELGGSAGNIAYSFQRLGGQSVVMATVGVDGQPYIDQMGEWGCNTTHVRVLPDFYTAQAFITTDRQHHQIAIFHPGAVNQCHLNHVHEVTETIRLAIVSPQGHQGMQQHMRECKEAAIPCLFDPGQGIPLFDEVALSEAVADATWLIVNEYEATMLEKKLKQSLSTIAQGLEALIVTRGEAGSTIYIQYGAALLSIPAVAADSVVDPTGCGDAYRAGLVYGLLQGWSWLKCGQLASLLGSIAVGSPGAQNHEVNRLVLADRYMELFQEPLWNLEG